MSENDADICINARPPWELPRPWYRPPPGVTKGPPRSLDSIIAGPLFSNDEGRRWFKDTHNYELAKNHSQDLNICSRLEDLVVEKGIAFGCAAAPRRFESGVCDFIIITQIHHGPFTNDGPECYEEVLQAEIKPVPGVKEETVKAWLKEELRQ